MDLSCLRFDLDEKYLFIHFKNPLVSKTFDKHMNFQPLKQLLNVFINFTRRLERLKNNFEVINNTTSDLENCRMLRQLLGLMLFLRKPMHC